jgi:tight adherence protein B
LQIFEAQFPDGLDALGRAMRAGHPFIAALETVAAETPPPLGTEIAKVCAETRFGLPITRSLDNLRSRIPLAQVDLFASAVQLHSRSGGRLTDAIANLCESLREQEALRGEVRALATHGRITGMILTVLPVVITLAMAAVNPTYIGVLLAHPYGKNMLAAAVVCLVAAQVIIRRIVDIRI